MRPDLSAALRATVFYFNPDCGINHILTREQLMANLFIKDSNDKKLTLAPNKREVIRVGKKGSDNK